MDKIIVERLKGNMHKFQDKKIKNNLYSVLSLSYLAKKKSPCYLPYYME